MVATTSALEVEAGLERSSARSYTGCDGTGSKLQTKINRHFGIHDRHLRKMEKGHTIVALKKIREVI